MIDENTPLVPSKPDPEEILKGEAAAKNPKSQVDWVFFVIALFGVFLALADESFVISTHDDIAGSFHQMSVGPWLLTVYSLGYTISLPTYGRLCYIYGHKRPLLAAYSIFAVGCAITGVAPSIWTVVAGRLISGAGASGMVDLISVIITDMAPLSEVAVLRSYMGLCCMLGFCSGAPLGGFFADLVGWRWSFLGQSPLGLLCLATAFWRIPSHGPTETSEMKKEPKNRGSPDFKRPNLDVLGLFFFTISITAFMFLCRSVAEDSWLNPLTLGSWVVFMISAIAFAFNERAWATDPLIPLWLLRTNGVGVTCLAHALATMSCYATLSSLTEYFIRAENVPDSIAGSYLLPLALGVALGSLISGPLIRRTKRYKSLAIGCLAIAMICFLLTAIRWRFRPSLWELAYVSLGYVALAGTLAAQFVGISASAPKEHSATAITTYYIFQQMGVILGVTLAATLSRQVFENALFQELGTDKDALQIIQLVLNDNRAAHSLPDAVRGIVQSCFLKSFQTVPIVSLCAASLSLVLMLTLREQPLE